MGEAEIRLVMKQTFISTSCFKYCDCGDTLGMNWKAKASEKMHRKIEDTIYRNIEVCILKCNS